MKAILAVMAVVILLLSIGLYIIQAASPLEQFCSNYCSKYLGPSLTAIALYLACMDGCMNG